MVTDTFCNIVRIHRAGASKIRIRKLRIDLSNNKWAKKRGQLMTAVLLSNMLGWVVSWSWQEASKQNRCYRRARIHSAITTVCANRTYTQPEVSKRSSHSEWGGSCCISVTQAWLNSNYRQWGYSSPPSLLHCRAALCVSTCRGGEARSGLIQQAKSLVKYLTVA